MDTVEVQIRIEKNDEGVKVLYGMFDVNPNIVLNITQEITPEEQQQLREELGETDWFMTRTHFTIDKYVQLNTALFEVYNERIEELE